MKKLSKRTIASRANGALSHGPKTEEGKKRSAFNTLRHGFLSKCVVLKDESEEMFKLLLDQHIAKLQPADDTEYAVVEELAATHWRVRRLWSIEATLYEQSIAKSPELRVRECIADTFAKLAAGPELALLNRYEGRLSRQYTRSLHNLRLLREISATNPNPSADPDLFTMGPALGGLDGDRGNTQR